MRILPTVALSALVMSSGCAAMHAQQQAALDHAVAVTPNVDQNEYTKVAIDPFACHSSMGGCDPSWTASASNSLSITLTRLGYQVFDTSTFHAWLEEPPPRDDAGASFEMHMDEQGMSMSAHDGEGGVSMEASASGSGSVVFYESLPPAEQSVIVERSGIRGVATGRITITPDDHWSEVHVLLSLADADSGGSAWRAEWRATVEAGREQEGIDQCMQVLDEALKRKIAVRGAPAQQAGAY